MMLRIVRNSFMVFNGGPFDERPGFYLSCSQ